MMKIRLGDMAVDANNLGLNEESMLYKYMDRTMYSMVTYNRLTRDGDLNKKEAMCKLAGVALYTKQRKRDLQKYGKSEIIYDNTLELKKNRRIL